MIDASTDQMGRNFHHKTQFNVKIPSFNTEFDLLFNSLNGCKPPT